MSVDAQNTPRTELVNLVRLAIGLRRGMPEHLLCNIVPHIGTDGLTCVQELATYLDTEDGQHSELAEQLGRCGDRHDPQCHHRRDTAGTGSDSTGTSDRMQTRIRHPPCPQ